MIKCTRCFAEDKLREWIPFIRIHSKCLQGCTSCGFPLGITTSCQFCGYKIMSKVIRNWLEFEVADAKGVKGFLLRSLSGRNGGEYIFRVYGPNHSRDNPHDFVDYDIRHFDLEVTIHGEAAFYVNEQQQILDYSPSTLGLKEVVILCIDEHCPNAGRHPRHV